MWGWVRCWPIREERTWIVNDVEQRAEGGREREKDDASTERSAEIILRENNSDCDLKLDRMFRKILILSELNYILFLRVILSYFFECFHCGHGDDTNWAHHRGEQDGEPPSESFRSYILLHSTYHWGMDNCLPLEFRDWYLKITYWIYWYLNCLPILTVELCLYVLLFIACAVLF